MKKTHNKFAKSATFAMLTARDGDKTRRPLQRRYEGMKSLLFFIFIFPSLLFANEPQEILGKYIAHKFGEYQSVFISCSGGETLFIDSGKAFKELKHIYSIQDKNEYGELLIAANLLISPINKSEYPKSHYTGTASINAFEVIVKNREPHNKFKNECAASGTDAASTRRPF